MVWSPQLWTDLWAAGFNSQTLATSSVSGKLTLIRNLPGKSQAVALSRSSALQLTKNLTGVVQSSSSDRSALAITRNLTGTVSSFSITSARVLPVSGRVQSFAQVRGGLAVTKLLKVTSRSGAPVQARLTTIVRFSGRTEAVSLDRSGLTQTKRLQGQIQSFSGLYAKMPVVLHFRTMAVSSANGTLFVASFLKAEVMAVGGSRARMTQRVSLTGRSAGRAAPRLFFVVGTTVAGRAMGRAISASPGRLSAIGISKTVNLPAKTKSVAVVRAGLTQRVRLHGNTGTHASVRATAHIRANLQGRTVGIQIVRAKLTTIVPLHGQVVAVAIMHTPHVATIVSLQGRSQGQTMWRRARLAKSLTGKTNGRVDTYSPTEDTFEIEKVGGWGVLVH